MNKSYLKRDLVTYSKLNNIEYIFRMNRALDIFVSLNISNMKDYYIYQNCINELKEITYEEIISYKRLADDEYFKSIEQLYLDLKNDDKVIHFPKVV